MLTGDIRVLQNETAVATVHSHRHGYVPRSDALESVRSSKTCRSATHQKSTLRSTPATAAATSSSTSIRRECGTSSAESTIVKKPCEQGSTLSCTVEKFKISAKSFEYGGIKEQHRCWSQLLCHRCAQPSSANQLSARVLLRAR